MNNTYDHVEIRIPHKISDNLTGWGSKINDCDCPQDWLNTYNSNAKKVNVSSVNPGELKVCSSTTCVNNPSSNCYSSIDADEAFLYPYLKPKKSKRKTWVQLNIYGSAIVAAWKQIVIVYLIMVLTSLLLVFDIVPQSVFPVETFAFGHIFAIFSFLVGIYYSIAYQNQREALENFAIDLMGNSIDASMNIAAFINESRVLDQISTFQYDFNGGVPKEETKTVYCVLQDLNFILKSMPYAVKHNYRTSEEFNADRLPLPKTLRNEILSGMKNGLEGVEVMRQMFTDRVGDLIQAQVILAPSGNNLLGKSDLYGGVFGKLDYLLKRAAMPRILFNLTIVSLWIYCIYLVFSFWEYWAIRLSLWAYYPVLLLISSILLSLFNAITTISNPFEDPEKSNFIYIDTGRIANENARQIDGHFRIVKNKIQALIVAGKLKNVNK